MQFLSLTALCALLLLFFGRLYSTYQHGKRARAMGCRPPIILPDSIFGLQGFTQLCRAVKEKRLMEFIAYHHGIHGHTFEFNMLNQKIICSVAPQNLRAILATQFSDYGLGLRPKQFSPLLGQGIFTQDGNGWAQVRGLLRPQFARTQVADIGMLADHVTFMMSLMPKDGSPFDIQPLFFQLTLSSATKLLLGESINTLATQELGKDLLEFGNAFDLAQDYLAARSRAQSLYWLVNPPKFRRAVRHVHEVIDRYVQLSINQAHRRSRNPQVTERYIFLDALAKQSEDPRVLRDNLLNVLLAGRDTTASLLSSTIYYLARHPYVWARLRREIVQAFGTSSQPVDEITHAKLKDIPYLRYVLNEVLRLLPPVPLNFRVAVRDTSLPTGGGQDGTHPIYVPKGTLIAYSVYTMHRQVELWGPDAEQFRPERWEENGKRGWEYLPFNGGPRICIGQQYALTEASYTIVRLLQEFESLEPADEQNTVEGPVLRVNLTLSHDEGVLVRLSS